MHIAAERKYHLRELLKYDLVPFNNLFNNSGLMTKPQSILVYKNWKNVFHIGTTIMQSVD